jgi:hypothetical protein
MRSTLNVRICHLLRVMRQVAPVEWERGLPFPTNAARARAAAAADLPEEISFSAWFESRAKVWQPIPAKGMERPLAA